MDAQQDKNESTDTKQNKVNTASNPDRAKAGDNKEALEKHPADIDQREGRMNNGEIGGGMGQHK